MYLKFKKILYFLIHFWRFGSFGFTSFIEKPIRINGRNNMFFGKHVYLKKFGWISTVKVNDKIPRIEINDNVKIGDFYHIISVDNITIEENVLIANNVYISDNTHSYYNVDMPIMNQPVECLKAVKIGKNSWIGENVSILGANIGMHSIIGAHSVVTKDIPDFSVAVGIPAKIIKRYNKITKIWEKLED